MQSPSASTLGHTVVITLGETLDTTMFPAFRRIYEDAADSVDHYVVDLSRTRRIDSAASSMLLLLREHAGGGRSQVRLVNAGPALQQDMKAMNFDLLFEVA